jgi:hypothetical protein
MQIVRAAPAGVTGRTVLRPEIFETLNETLWAPGASFVIAAKASDISVYAGGALELHYTDATKGMVSLAPFGWQLKWDCNQFVYSRIVQKLNRWMIFYFTGSMSKLGTK